MKRIILLAVAALFASAPIFAQDLNEAIETFNNGLNAYQAGNNQSALESLQSALKIAEACGDEGAEIAANCKTSIPKVVLSLAKDAAKAKQYDEAIAKAQEAAKLAEEYGNEDVKADAETLVPGLRQQKATSLVQAKDYENAIAAYQDVLADNPDNSKAYLQLGSCYAATGKTDEAIEAYKTALDKGEQAAAKMLSKTYLRIAQTSSKEKKYQAVIDACNQANSYEESADAYYLAGGAASQLQKSTEAIGYYEKFLELAPTDPRAGGVTYTVGALYEASNKTKALEYYNKVANDPKFGEQAQARIKALQQ